MKKRKQNNTFVDCLNSVASSTECTGLIQIPPENEEEMEAYQDIYAIHNQPIKKK